MSDFMKNFTAYETVPLTCVANSSASVKFALPASVPLEDCLIYNSGTAVAFVGFGNSNKGSVTAQVPGTTGTTNATMIPPGAYIVLRKNANKDYGGANTCAAWSTGTPTLYFTSGLGS